MHYQRDLELEDLIPSKYYDKIYELASEIEVCQAKSSSLEVSLQMAGEKEKELTKLLNLVTDEKKRLEEASSGSMRRR
ncbi:hypothetical protein OIU79_013338 [Salix purpurea]|uniref:Uncharacterized protein n=1 Tax=Salix purpurea TaxID=77065 RepID=A0A9Q0Q5N3_SALPP|nr:hypothetical protein OIU79_013338 [Salix purpurea]